MRAKKTLATRQKYEQDKLMEDRAKGLEKNQTRSWKAGDVYAPRDLGPGEMRKWRRRQAPAKDAFDALGLDPLKQYKVRIALLPLQYYEWVIR
jgi:small subunit ribosomal protein S18